MTSYVGLFRGSRDSGWEVSFPDAPGCVAKGDSFKEAFEAARMALADYLALMDDPPRPRSTAEILIDSARDKTLNRALVGAVMHWVPFDDPRDPMAAIRASHGAPPLKGASALSLPA